VTVAAVRGRRSLIGALIDAAPGFRRLAAKTVPYIREHAVTAAAFSAIDWGCWDAGRIPGLIVTGASVLLLDWLVRG
jgi:hypothetical protein